MSEVTLYLLIVEEGARLVPVSHGASFTDYSCLTDYS